MTGLSTVLLQMRPRPPSPPPDDWVLVRLYANMDILLNDGNWLKQTGMHKLPDGSLDLKAVRKEWNLEQCTVIDPARLEPFHPSDPDRLSPLALSVLTEGKYNSKWKGSAPSLAIIPYKVSEAPPPPVRPDPPPPKHEQYAHLLNQNGHRAEWRKSQSSRRLDAMIAIALEREAVPPCFFPILTALRWIDECTPLDADQVMVMFKPIGMALSWAYKMTKVDVVKLFGVWVLVLAVMLFLELSLLFIRLVSWFLYQ